MRRLEALREAVEQLIAAEIADAQKGGGYVEDIPIIEAELVTARALYELELARLELQ